MNTDQENKDKNKDSSPEHTPPISFNVQLEKAKKDARELEEKMRKSGKMPEPIIITEDNNVKKVSDLNIREQREEIIRCASDPIYFIETYLTIFDQTKGEGGQIVPFKLFDYQKRLIGDYLENRFVIANKYRQAGISTCTCAYIAWYVAFKENRSVAIVANKLETAANELMYDVVEFINGCPDWLVPNVEKNTQKLKRYDNGCQLAAFSSTGLRGYTPTLLFWDETAWTENGDKFWTSAGPTLQTGGRAMFISTPNGLDPVYYKTFNAARQGKSNFKAVELWWFNDPRYNKNLSWVKHKGRENETWMDDKDFSDEERIKLQDDGWEATSPWFEEQVQQANGDMRKVAQELLCVFGDSILSIKNTESNKTFKITIEDLYDKLIKLKEFRYNNKYQILNSSGEFVDFLGIDRSKKENVIKVTLENDKSITVSEDHIFIAGNKNIHANSLTPNVSYLSTIDGDYFVKNVEYIKNNKEYLYDIVDSVDYDYFANDIINHNCSFLGSGDNFIAEEYIRRIEEEEMRTPIRQEYTDKNFWIFEDPQPGEEYIMPVDASPGHGDDNSAINILKIKNYIEEQVINKNGVSKKIKVKRSKAIQVAEYYGKVTPQLLAEIAYQFGKAYNNAYVVVDITGGYGVQTVEKLIEIGYENIHYAEVNHKPSRDRLNGYIKKGNKTMADGNIVSVDLIPGFFIGNNRPSVLLEMQRSIHLEDVIIRSVRLLNELKTFVTVPGNRVADHKRSFHDDSIMALAIGLYVLNFDMGRYKQSKETTMKMLDAFLNVNDPQKMAEKDNKNPKRENVEERRNRPEAHLYAKHSWLFK